VVAGWAVLLLVFTYVSLRKDEPTVREQRSIAEASPVADRVIGALVAAAALDPDVVVELPARQVTTGCRITPIRDGATLQRQIILRTTEADGPGLLGRIADRMPAAYLAGTRNIDGVPRFRADAGEFVAVKGGVTEPGVITLAASTGCRPTSPDFRPAEPAAAPAVDQEAGRVLGALATSTDGRRQRISAPCSAGGEAYAVLVAVPGAPPASLAAALRPLAGGGAVVVTDQPDGYAYRAGPLSVAVRAAGGEIRVAVSAGCSGQ
jgi:hypothetical protein